MKKILAFSLVLTMLVAVCCACFVVNAEETAKTFWVTHFAATTENATSNEGAGVIFTEAYKGGQWWMHVAFKPVADTDAYEIVEIVSGISDGKAEPLAIPEGGFVYAANIGNNYPALVEQGKTEYEGKPNYASQNVQNMVAAMKEWKVGDQFVFSGLDLANKTVPTTTPDKNWYDPDYKCTATFAPYVSDKEVVEVITVDGKLDDTGWVKANWFDKKGIWQNVAETDPTPDIEASYAVRSDADNIYIGIRVAEGAVFKADNTSDGGSFQTGSTNFRIWFHGDQMAPKADGSESRTFYDVLLNAQKEFVVYHEKKAPAEGKGMKAAWDVSSDKQTTVELCIAKSAISAVEGFKMFVSYSSPEIKENEIVAYNALHLVEFTPTETDVDENGKPLNLPKGWSGSTRLHAPYKFADVVLGTYEKDDQEPSAPADDEAAKYTEEIAAKVTAVENAKINVKMDSKLEGNKVIVTVTVDDIAADAKAALAFQANLHYDADKVTLDKSEAANTGNSIGKYTSAPEGWVDDDYLTVESTTLENTIEIFMGTGKTNNAITKDAPLVMTFTFDLKEGATMAGFWIDSESVKTLDGESNENGDSAQGAYTVAKVATAPVESSSEAESSSKAPVAPKPGDSGIIVFTILGIVAVAGAAVIVKARH